MLCIGPDRALSNCRVSRLTGKTATITGKPDFIEENYGEIQISDVKTGRASDQHGSG